MRKLIKLHQIISEQGTDFEKNIFNDKNLFIHLVHIKKYQVVINVENKFVHKKLQIVKTLEKHECLIKTNS